DVRRARDLLEDALGAPIAGYRAPYLIQNPGELWAIDVLAALGFRYGAGYVPLRWMPYAGRSAPRAPFRHPSGVWEFPLPIAEAYGGWNLPYAGGGPMLRFLSYRTIHRFLVAHEAAVGSAVVYLHPWELAPVARALAGTPLHVRLWKRVGRARTLLARAPPDLLRAVAHGDAAARAALAARAAADGRRARPRAPRAALARGPRRRLAHPVGHLRRRAGARRAPARERGAARDGGRRRGARPRAGALRQHGRGPGIGRGGVRARRRVAVGRRSDERPRRLRPRHVRLRIRPRHATAAGDRHALSDAAPGALSHTRASARTAPPRRRRAPRPRRRAPAPRAHRDRLLARHRVRAAARARDAVRRLRPRDPALAAAPQLLRHRRRARRPGVGGARRPRGDAGRHLHARWPHARPRSRRRSRAAGRGDVLDSRRPRVSRDRVARPRRSDRHRAADLRPRRREQRDMIARAATLFVFAAGWLLIFR